MISTTLFPGRYVQGSGALARLGQEVSRFGKSCFVVCDPFVHDRLLSEFLPEMDKQLKVALEKFTGECSDEEIARLATIAADAQCEVVVGIGGGKSLDTAKALAHQLKKPVAIVPTIASTDAPCSALAVIYTREGAFKRYLLLPKNPDLVLVDSGIVARSPARFVISGMGDALATWFEAESCHKKYAGNMSGDKGSMTAYSLAELCFKTLMEYGEQAVIACAAQAVTPALERIVEANTLLSGLGFESGGLAAAHAIHNGLTVLPGTHQYFHGEKVAIGTLTSLILTDKPAATIERVFSFCERVGLPTTLADIGLSEVTDAALQKVAEAACAEGETIHNEPIPVTAAMVVAALKAADAYGRKRKRA